MLNMNKLMYALQNLSTKNSLVQTVLYNKNQDFDSFLNKVLIASRSIVKYLYTKVENHSPNDKQEAHLPYTDNCTHIQNTEAGNSPY